MIPEAHVTHRVPHRLRLKIPAKRRDTGYFDAIAQHFSSMNGLESVEANPLTATLLITHDLDIDTFLLEAQEKGFFSLQRTSPPEMNIHKVVTGHFSDIDNQIKGFTKGSLNVGGAAFLALVGVGLYQISRGNFAAPAWYTAFWYAMNIFLKSKGNGNETAE
jgi:hypothetical protein